MGPDPLNDVVFASLSVVPFVLFPQESCAEERSAGNDGVLEPKVIILSISSLAATFSIREISSQLWKAP